MENTINLKSTNGTTVSNFSELEEIWKDIKNYEGFYQVSNYGNVKSLGNGKSNNSKERVLKFTIINNGYCQVTLCKEREKKHYLVHRLVSQAFIPNPDNLPCVNHKNEQKTDNRVENLEYCTVEYNNNYGTHNERLSIAHKGLKHTQETKEKIGESHQKPIVQIHKSGLIIGVWDSIIEIERKLGIDNSSITRCCKGKQKTAGKYKWKYLNELKQVS